jgi:hypothetical protein
VGVADDVAEARLLPANFTCECHFPLSPDGNISKKANFHAIRD